MGAKKKKKWVHSKSIHNVVEKEKNHQMNLMKTIRPYLVMK